MDNTLKHRLIGAIVLVALAVIFLPALVKGPTVEGAAAGVSLSAPAAPGEGQFQTRELPLVVPAGQSLPAPAGQPDAPVLDDAADPEPAPEAVAAGDYAVNFGAYDSQANAGIVVDMLGKAGLVAYTEPTTVNGRDAWRVRIGPFADRAAAEAARVKASAINSSVKAQVVVLDGAAAPSQATPPAPAPAMSSSPVPVTPPTATPLQANQAAALPPRTAQTERVPAAEAERTRATVVQNKPAPAPKPAEKPAEKPAAPKPAPKPVAAAPAAASVGWAVQLGAFTSAADANALRDRVRAAGFSAFVEQVPTDRGSLTRVRVGPVASREDAEQLKARVASSQGVSGMVVRHP